MKVTAYGLRFGGGEKPPDSGFSKGLMGAQKSKATGSTQGELTLGDLGQVTFSLGLQFPRASQVGFSGSLRWLGALGASCWL